MNRFKTILISSISLIVVNSAYGDAWFNKWMGIMDNIDNIPTNGQIETLGSVVRVGSKGVLTEEETTVYRRSQALLLAIPGHAGYYQDRINEARG